ncbi:MAG: family 1 extracellular solute-binding protein [Paenibacillaceae bacterium]|nr:family 1 extracellular solute-binding protein [Paenibacillaceae bacterium]
MLGGKWRHCLTVGMIAVSLILAAGCSGNSVSSSGGNQGAGETGGSTDSGKQANLKVFFFEPGFVDTDFTAKFAPHLQKKYPNITYELINSSKDQTIENMIAGNDVPDIIFAGEKEIAQLSVLGIPEDLNPMIKQHKLDMEQYEPVANTTIKSYSDKGEILALMFSLQYYATFYNKDIFDKFGVPYPKDGMSWDDLIGLGKKLTREEGGNQYYGLQMGNVSELGLLYRLDLADSKTKKTFPNQEGWKKVLALGKEIYGIPGNLEPLNKSNSVSTVFTKDQNVAISPYYGDSFVNKLRILFEQGKPMNWDMTCYPSLKEQPGKSHELSFRSLVISKTSKYKEQAFQVAQLIATSPETQTQLAKDGFQAAMKDDSYKKVFGENLASLKGKNVSAIFKTIPMPIHHVTIYDSPTVKATNAPFYDFLNGKTDANTALRLAQEAADKAIAELK